MANGRAAKGPVDRRARQRFPVRLRLSVECGEQQPRYAISHDACELGISFYSDKPIAIGSRICFAVKVPPDVAEFQEIHMHGTVTVIRIEDRGDGQVLIAAVTDKYDFHK